jgi:hypothetical protein
MERLSAEHRTALHDFLQLSFQGLKITIHREAYDRADM